MEQCPKLALPCLINFVVTSNCEVEDIPKYTIKGMMTQFTIISEDDNDDCCTRGGSQVTVQLGGVNDTTQVRDNNDSYMASFVPMCNIGITLCPCYLISVINYIHL